MAETTTRTALEPLRALRYPYRQNSRRPQGIEDDLFEEYDKIPIEEFAMAAGAPQATVLRLPMIFGPDDKQHRFAWAIKGAKQGERTHEQLVELLRAGNGAAAADLWRRHIDAVADFVSRGSDLRTVLDLLS